MSGAMQSNVGNSQIYEANEQRPNKTDVGQHHNTDQPIGQLNAHNLLDGKDSRTHANTSAAYAEMKKQEHAETHEVDPLAPARKHGNEPSRGAKIDAELQREEEELLAKKNA